MSGLYEWLFTDLADPRTKTWPMMDGPIRPIFVMILYLYIIKVWLPKWMENKRPYDIKTLINIYNMFQIISNFILFQGILTSGWTTTLHLGCTLVDYSDNPESLRMANWMWWTVMLKFCELIETAFFILRKKNEQASFLHIYHHIITITIMWMTTKYTPGAMASLTPMINSFVHVIMYAYYLLTSIGSPKIRRTLNKYKLWLTVIQMIQFTMLLLHSLQALHPSCPFPAGMTYFYIPNLLCVYSLFVDFFRKTYFKNATKTKN